MSQGRGAVERWDGGEYRMIEESPERLALVFLGERLRGAAVLEKAPPQGGEAAQRWRLCLSASTEACWNTGGDTSSESSVRPAR